VMHIGIICDDVFRTKIVINSAYIFFKKVIFTTVILPNFCYTNKNNFFFLDYCLAKIFGTWFVLTSWCLHWIAFMRLSIHIIGGISTHVPASSSPG
jgi:hypothetical protein